MTEHDTNLRTDLAKRLRGLRAGAGLTQSALADQVGIHQGALSKIELGKRPIDPVTARLWATACGASPDLVEAAWTAARWCEVHATDTVILRRGDGTGQAALDAQREWREAERGAGLVESFHPLRVPGVLQTPGYARAMFSTDLHRTYAPVELDALVAERCSRWPQLIDGDRRSVLLVGEAALLTGIGDWEVMASQCSHLAELITETMGGPLVRIGIVPLRTVVRVSPLGGFTLYGDLQRHTALAVAVNVASGLLHDDRDLKVMAGIFDELVKVALFERAAVELAAIAAAEWNECADDLDDGDVGE